jgi:plasmid stability protein
MATLLIREIPEAIYRKLKRRAKEHGTSMNREALRLLSQGLEVPVQNPEEFLASVRELRRSLFIRRPQESVAGMISKMRAAR